MLAIRVRCYTAGCIRPAKEAFIKGGFQGAALSQIDGVRYHHTALMFRLLEDGLVGWPTAIVHKENFLDAFPLKLSNKRKQGFIWL